MESTGRMGVGGGGEGGGGCSGVVRLQLWLDVSKVVRP